MPIKVTSNYGTSFVALTTEEREIAWQKVLAPLPSVEFYFTPQDGYKFKIISETVSDSNGNYIVTIEANKKRSTFKANHYTNNLNQGRTYQKVRALFAN